MAKPKPAPLPAGTDVGPYRVVRALASGGSSVVYLARSPGGLAVLLKEYLPGELVHRLPGDRVPLVRPGRLGRVRQGLAGFFGGARHLTHLQHPGLPTVLDCVQDHETVYLVLRYLQGRTLQDHIVLARARRVAGCLSEASVLSVALDLLSVLEVVHEAGLLHLDIKPANLLLSLEGRLVLLDFDAAQRWTEGGGPAPLPPASTPAHTPGFSAPETLAHAASHGPWTDLYAVGACLYAALTGLPPPTALERAAHDTVPQVLQGLQGTYSAALLDAVGRSMGLGVAGRPQSVAQMRANLMPAAQSAAAAAPLP